MKSNSYNARIFYFHKGKQIIVILVLMEIVTGSISQNMFQKVRSNITGIYIYTYICLFYLQEFVFLYFYSYILIFLLELLYFLYFLNLNFIKNK